MPPVTFVFERIIDEIERRVGRAISDDQIEADPRNGLAIVDHATKDVLGEPNTREILVIMASIENIDEYTMDTRSLDVENEVSLIVKDCFAAVLDQRLEPIKTSVAALSFAAGFAPSAERLLSLAEHAAEVFPASKVLKPNDVSKTREALEKVLDKNGTRADLETVLRSTDLFRALLSAPNDRVLWQRHELDVATVQGARSEMKEFKKMLGLGYGRAEDALTAISNRAESELRPPARHDRNVVPSP